MSFLYTPAIVALGTKLLDLVADDIRALLIEESGGYTPNQTTHDFLNDVAAGARLGSAVALASKTFTLGVYDSADVTFVAPTAGHQVDAVLLYSHAGGADSARRLIAYINTGYNLPLATNGNNVLIQLPVGGFFRIGP